MRSKKFLLTSSLVGSILFLYVLLKNTKESLVFFYSDVSLFPFLKGYIVLPGSVIFMMIYQKFVDIFSEKTIFYGTTLILIFGLCILSFFILPELDLWVFKNVLDYKISYPRWKYFFEMIAFWPISCFYLMAEFWGIIMYNHLFWHLANGMHTSQEAMKFYGSYIAVGNVSTLLGGALWRSWTSEGLKHVLKNVSLSLLFLGSLLLVAYYFLGKYFQKKQFSQEEQPASFLENLSLVFKNSYLKWLGVIVICYGFAIVLGETIYRQHLQNHFTDPMKLGSFVAGVHMATSGLALGLVFLGRYILKTLGWRWTGLVTPGVLGATGLLFAFTLWGEFFWGGFAGVWVGASMIVGVRAGKHNFFDPTKEMVYLCLDDRLKAKGKAAVDVVGSRLGKAMAGYAISTLLILTSKSLFELRWVLMGALGFCCIVWIYGIQKLANQYENFKKAHPEQEDYETLQT